MLRFLNFRAKNCGGNTTFSQQITFRKDDENYFFFGLLRYALLFERFSEQGKTQALEARAAQLALKKMIEKFEKQQNRYEKVIGCEKLFVVKK